MIIPILEVAMEVVMDVEMECGGCKMTLPFSYKLGHKFVVPLCENCLLAHLKHHQKEVIEMACKEKKGGKVKK